MNILTVESISKTYGEKQLFDQISFGVAAGDRTGLIGLNGSGKSTLLKIVARLVEPDTGGITLRQGLRVRYLDQDPSFPPGATVLAAVMAGLTSPAAGEGLWELEAQARAMLTRLGITAFDRPIESLSGGERKRAALAQVLVDPADLLILDEPTNHIDTATVAWLEAQLARYAGALLLITHDRYFLDRVVTRILELDHGRLYSYEGGYGQFLELKMARQAGEASGEASRQNLLRRELAWLRRGAKARSTKQKARIDRVATLQEQRPQTATGRVEIAVAAHRLGREVLHLRDLAIGFDGRALIDGFSYSVLPRDRVGIVGPNGCGKSTLLKLIAGQLLPDRGEVATGQTVRLLYFDQETEEMDPGQRVIDYIKDVAEVIRTRDGATITAAQMLERFLFPVAVQYNVIGKLSGGERRRLYLLRKLMAEPNVILLDEPTNDLDIETLTVLEEYLEQFPGAVLAVSHDRYFLDRVAEHLLCFEAGGIRRYIGSCSEYLAERAAAALAESAPDRREPVAVPEKSRRSLKLSFKEQREWESIEGRIAELEGEVARLEQAMAAAATEHERLLALSVEHERARADLSQALDRWAELAEKVEAIEQEREKRE